MAVLCEDFEFEFFAVEPSMNDPLADKHSKKNSEHPTAELDEGKGATGPSVEKGRAVRGRNKHHVVDMSRELVLQLALGQKPCKKGVTSLE